MEHNDYELVELAHDGNEEAINLLYKKYKPIIIKKSKNAIMYATHHGIEINDIMQEGYIALDEAIRNYNQDSNATFYTFALLCINRQIVNYLRKTTGNRDKALNDAVMIDESLERVVSDDSDIELTILGKDNNLVITEEIRKILTNFERQVFDMRINDYTFEEIAKALNKDLKSIYNTFQRIKLKIKKNIKLDN